jgi:ATP synthase protein I
MNKSTKANGADGEPALSVQIGKKADLALRARRSSGSEVGFGLGMMGLIGWSVSVPTLLGAALGIWLDDHRPSNHSWTLALLVGGLVIGCFNAWNWVVRESKAIGESAEGSDD